MYMYNVCQLYGCIFEILNPAWMSQAFDFNLYSKSLLVFLLNVSGSFKVFKHPQPFKTSNHDFAKVHESNINKQTNNIFYNLTYHISRIAVFDSFSRYNFKIYISHTFSVTLY